MESVFIIGENSSLNLDKKQAVSYNADMGVCLWAIRLNLPNIIKILEDL
jgi:hypothetical protein